MTLDDHDDLRTKDHLRRDARLRVRDVLIYCGDHRCSHHVEVNADGWPDDARLSGIEPKFTCTRCGKRGAEIRPKSSQARMGTA
jgi:hypothetical protein